MSKINELEERIAKLEKRQELDKCFENGIVSRVMTILTNITIDVKSTLDIQGVMYDKDKFKNLINKESEV